MDYLERNHHAVLDLMSLCRDIFDNYAVVIKPHHEFDLVAIGFGECFRVRVICSGCKNPSGAYVANLLKSGSHAGKKSSKKPFSQKDCDFIFVVTPEGKYLIPSKKVTQTKAITLSMFEEFILPTSSKVQG